MEPRPQRPRTVGGQGQPQLARGGAPGGQAAAGDYPPGAEGADPTTFIAPSRTEYDYSPLDLAPPGQRRRRQIVAAAVGLLTLLLLGAVGVFAYLLVRDEGPGAGSNLAASQTEVARDSATVAAQQTLVAQSAAQETAAAGGVPASPDAATAASDPEEEAAGADATREATEPRVATGAGAGRNADEAPTADELTALLPDQALMPEDLTDIVDTERSLEEVVQALGGEPEVEQSLEEWGWSGNVERIFNAPDPSALAADAPVSVSVSLHGFRDEDAAGDALPVYADALASAGYEEIDAPNLGDSAQMLRATQEDGTQVVALYIQQGNVLYRIGGASPGGDPTAVVTDVAEQLLERNASE